MAGAGGGRGNERGAVRAGREAAQRPVRQQARRGSTTMSKLTAATSVHVAPYFGVALRRTSGLLRRASANFAPNFALRRGPIGPPKRSCYPGGSPNWPFGRPWSPPRCARTSDTRTRPSVAWRGMRPTEPCRPVPGTTGMAARTRWGQRAGVPYDAPGGESVHGSTEGPCNRAQMCQWSGAAHPPVELADTCGPGQDALDRLSTMVEVGATPPRRSLWTPSQTTWKVGRGVPGLLGRLPE
jgi:hypothetical protein